MSLFLSSQSQDEAQHDEVVAVPAGHSVGPFNRTHSQSQADSQSPPSQTAFTACTTQVSHLADVLSAITTINSSAMMIIKPTGIVFFAEHNHISNVQLNIDPSLFSQYNFSSDSEELRLGIDIALISDSFQSVASTIVGKKSSKSAQANNAVGGVESVTCYITYAGEGHALIIEFEDHLVSEKLEFLTFYLDIDYPDPTSADDDGEYLVINHSEIEFELILKSDVLANLLADLQQINTVELYIHISNELRTLGTANAANSNIKFYKNELNFISKGPIGHSKLIYPSEKTILEKMQIFHKLRESLSPVNSSVVSCYNFANFIAIQKAVKLSTKCKVLKDLNGILSLQFLCKNYQLPNYAGTLITFHLLEIAPLTIENEVITTGETPHKNANNSILKSIVDDESYDYVKHVVGATGNSIMDNQNQQITAPVGHEDEEYIPLSYAAFRNDKQDDKRREIEIQDTHKEPEKKKRKNDEGITTVGGAVEVPLFL